MPDLAETIETLATSPSKASGDGGSVEMPKIGEVIEAKRDKASDTAAAKGHRGLRFSQLVPPGAT